MSNTLTEAELLNLAIKFIPKALLESSLANTSVRLRVIKGIFDIAENIQKEHLKRKGPTVD